MIAMNKRTITEKGDDGCVAYNEVLKRCMIELR